MTGRVAKRCIVDGCDWVHLIDPPTVSQEALGNVFGPGVVSTIAFNEWQAKVEAELRTHLESHDCVDWAKTIARLQNESTSLRAEVERALTDLTDHWEKEAKSSDDDEYADRSDAFRDCARQVGLAIQSWNRA